MNPWSFPIPVGQGLPHKVFIGPCTCMLPMHECLGVFTDKVGVRKQDGWGTLRLFLYEVGERTASVVLKNKRRGQESFSWNTRRVWFCFKPLRIKANAIYDPAYLALFHATPSFANKPQPGRNTFRILTMPSSIAQSFFLIIASVILYYNWQINWWNSLLDHSVLKEKTMLPTASPESGMQSC